MLEEPPAACEEHFAIWHHQLCQQQSEAVVRTQEQLGFSFGQVLGDRLKIVKGHCVLNGRAAITEDVEELGNCSGELPCPNSSSSSGRCLPVSGPGLAYNSGRRRRRHRKESTCHAEAVKVRLPSLDIAVSVGNCEQRLRRADEQHHENAGHCGTDVSCQGSSLKTMGLPRPRNRTEATFDSSVILLQRV
jgi:hypothetical protein